MFFYYRCVFSCNQWLALNKGDGRTSCTLQVSNFQTHNQGAILRDNINRKIFDDHIWLSVGVRKTKSNFTRLQRLSVCLSLLFMTMIANAMWYRTEETKDSTQSFQFGPITFTVHQLYTSVMSSLICVPPVLLITILFRKAKSRPNRNISTKNEQMNSNKEFHNNNSSDTKMYSPRFNDLKSITSDKSGDTLHRIESSASYDLSDLDDSDVEIEIAGISQQMKNVFYIT